jgi:hypothetical protein
MKRPTADHGDLIGGNAGGSEQYRALAGVAAYLQNHPERDFQLSLSPLTSD